MLIAQRPTLTEETISEFRSASSSSRSSPASATPSATRCAAPCCRPSPAPPSRASASTACCTSSAPSRVSRRMSPRSSSTSRTWSSRASTTSPSPPTCASSGAGEVTAADISAPAGVEVHNPELVIATLNDNAEVRARAHHRARPRLRLGDPEPQRVHARPVRFRSTRSTRRCSRSPTASRRRVPASAPTSTAWWSTSRPSPRSPRATRVASAGRTLTELFGLARELNAAAEGIEIGPAPVDAVLSSELSMPIEDLDLSRAHATTASSARASTP